MKKAILIIASLIILVIAGLILYVKFALPDVSPAPVLKVTITPEKVKRGEYLANHVSVCMDCHSERDWSKFAAPIVAGTFGAGGEVFDHKMGFPGIYTSKNLTPYHLGSWTDGEIYRAIVSGVDREGNALFPIMPYRHYAHMAKEDIEAIIAYIRTLEPVESEIPESRSDFPMNLIINTIPEDANPPERRPDKSDIIAYGKYVTTIAGCADCHTPMEKGKYVEGMKYAGGFEFHLPTGTVRTPNITPHKENGIGKWTRETFIQRFKMYSDTVFQPYEVTEGFNTTMPWLWYADMTEEDLSAIYAYLMSLKPIENRVVRFDERKGESSN